jgi:hypothetical protein
MFTPPPFNLGFSSQENSDTSPNEIPLKESTSHSFGLQEDARSAFAIDVAPLAWAESQGIANNLGSYC